MDDYSNVVYSEKERPYTTYPYQLCKYLYNRFNFNPNAKFLEVGCGRGEHLHYFMKLGLDVHGIDISKQASRFNQNLSISFIDIEKSRIPFPDSTFDIIYSKSFIEHLSSPEKYFKEAVRVLKKGGLLLTLVPDWESNFKIYFDDYTHKRPFSIVSLRDIYLINNFVDVSVYKFRQLPIVWKYPILNILCSAIAPFIPVRTKYKFLKWSRELMLIGIGYKK